MYSYQDLLADLYTNGTFDTHIVLLEPWASPPPLNTLLVSYDYTSQIGRERNDFVRKCIVPKLILS